MLQQYDYVHIISLDFSKAFDTVRQNRWVHGANIILIHQTSSSSAQAQSALRDCVGDSWWPAAARDGLEAVLSRQRQRSRQRRGKAAMFLTEARQGRGRGRELEAEARQSEIDVVCVILISCTMHM